MRSPDSRPSTIQTPPRFWTLEVLRGACALVVFLSHVLLWSDFAPQAAGTIALRRTGDAIHEVFKYLFWPEGANHPALICFFVLSGFCIHFPYAWRRKQGLPPGAWTDYFRRRAYRLMPVYWLAAVCGFIFVAAQKFSPASRPLLELHAISTPAGIAARMLAITGFFPREVLAGNLPLNNTAVEIVLYALYPMLFALMAARGGWRLIWTIFATLQLATIPLTWIFSPFWVFNSFAMMGLFWIAGAWGAEKIIRDPKSFHGAWALGAWGCLIATRFVPYFYGVNLVKQAICGAFFLLAILWMTSRELRQGQRPPDRFAVRFLRYCALVSYSLYAVHTPVMFLIEWTLVKIGRPVYSLQLALNFFFAGGVSLLVFYFVEQVFYRPRVSTPPLNPEPAPAILSAP